MTERNHFIDISKAIAIILVLFNHYEWAENSVFNTHLYYWVINLAVPFFMMATGYVTAMSFERHGIDKKQAYSKKNLLPKLARYTMPVVWFYLAETILTFVLNATGYLQYVATLDFPYNYGYGKPMTLLGTIVFFFAGGRGQHGTYYFPIIIQVALIIPLIYAVVKKSRFGLWLCFGANLAFELIKVFMSKVVLANLAIDKSVLAQAGVNNAPVDQLSGSLIVEGVYRFCALRYVFALALGVFIYLNREKLGKVKWYIMFPIGVAYTILMAYTSYEANIFFTWKYTSMMSLLFMAPLFVLGHQYLKNVKCKPLEEIGKASYHILMVQILYYNFLAPLVWTAPKSVIPNDAVGFIIGLVICIGGGYGYYRLYKFGADKYRLRKQKKVKI